MRGEVKIGPVNLDGTYAISQRTMFGVDAGPRQSYDGSFYFVGAGGKPGPVNLKAFAYLLDYDERDRLRQQLAELWREGDGDAARSRPRSS